jgi:hypothetical protein
MNFGVDASAAAAAPSTVGFVETPSAAEPSSVGKGALNAADVKRLCDVAVACNLSKESSHIVHDKETVEWNEKSTQSILAHLLAQPSSSTQQCKEAHRPNQVNKKPRIEKAARPTGLESLIASALWNESDHFRWQQAMFQSIKVVSV